MRRNTVWLIALLSLVLGSRSLPGAVSYTVGSANVAPGSDFSVAITVDSTLTSPSTYWNNASFNLVWDEDVLTLQLTPVGLTGSPLPLGLSNFGTGTSGQLNFSWLFAEPTGNGYEVVDGSTLFTVNFTATGAAGSSTPLSFQSGSIAIIGLTDSLGGNDTSVTPTGINGSVQVVPEPVNYALGLFAVIFLGTAGVRWVSNRRKPQHSMN